MFTRYQHIERYGTDAVDGIELGKVYIFSKLDGSNSSVWTEGDFIKTGSRNRELSLGNDNQGFYTYIKKQPNISAYLKKYPSHRLFGEWLVPHTLKTYHQKAWNKFYIFDVMVEDRYINYDVYKEWLDEFNLEYIPAICSIQNSQSERLYHQLSNSNFLIEDGLGLGEGVVIKNYDFVNKHGHTVWAKIVRSDFKAEHSKSMGHPEIQESETVELKIVEKFVTPHLVQKEYAKITTEMNGWESKYIPRLLSTVYHDLIQEEMWEILKAYKNPTINFRALRNFTTNKIKQIKKEIFT